MMEIAFTITRPPSTNNLFSNVPGKGRVKTAKYKAWITAAGWEMKAEHSGILVPRFEGPCAVAIEGVKRIDVDNSCKPVLDLLQAMNVLANDKLVEELRVCRSGACGEGKVRVSIWEI